MKLGMSFLDIFPPSVAFSSHFLHSALRWTAAKQAPAQYSRTSPLPALFLYPSNLTSALLIFQQLGMGESALGEKSKEFAFIRQLWYTRHCATLSIKSLMPQMSSMFHTKENWVSKKLWSPRTSREPGFEAKHCGTYCCIVSLIPKKGLCSRLRHGRVLPLSGHLTLNPLGLWFPFSSFGLNDLSEMERIFRCQPHKLFLPRASRMFFPALTFPPTPSLVFFPSCGSKYISPPPRNFS